MIGLSILETPMGRRKNCLVSPGVYLKGLHDELVAVEALLDFTAICCSRKIHRHYCSMVKKAKAGTVDAVELLMKMEYTLDSFAQRNGFMFGQHEERSDEWGFYD